MARYRRASAVTMGIVLSLALVVGCGSDSEDAPSASADTLARDPELGGADLITKAGKEGRVTVYTANTLEQAQAMADAFHKDFPNIEVEVVRKGGAELYQLVESELRADKLRADVLDESDLGLAQELPKDVFADYKIPSDAKYPAQYTRGVFYPVYEDPHGFAYNTALVDEADAPKTWQDYLSPKFNGRRAHVAAGAGGCSWILALFQGRVLGEQQGGDHQAYWKKVAATKPTISPSNGELIQRLTQGEVKITTMLTGPGRGAIDSGAPVKLVYPPEGVPACIHAQAVVAKSAHPNAARLYHNWSLSKRGQTVWVHELGGFSVRTDMPAPPSAPPDVKIWPTPVDDFLNLANKWLPEWDEIFHYKP